MCNMYSSPPHESPRSPLSLCQDASSAHPDCTKKHRHSFMPGRLIYASSHESEYKLKKHYFNAVHVPLLLRPDADNPSIVYVSPIAADEMWPHRYLSVGFTYCAAGLMVNIRDYLVKTVPLSFKCYNGLYGSMLVKSASFWLRSFSQNEAKINGFCAST